MPNHRPDGLVRTDFDHERPRPRGCGGGFRAWRGLREGKERTTMALVRMSYILIRAEVVVDAH